MRRTYIISTALSATFTGLSALSVYIAAKADIVTQKFCFTALTLILIIFLWQEIKRVRISQPVRWLFNPAVLCSIMTFYLYFGVNNIIYFFPRDSISLVGLSPDITLVMNKLMLLVILGAIAMWLGYWSSLTTRLMNSRILSRLQHKYFDIDSTPKIWVLPALYIIAVGGRLAEVWLGVYGYSSNYQRSLDAASYTQFLVLMDNMGLLALIIIALQYYGKNPAFYVKFYFIGIFIGELFWGLLSGMKSGVMIPFLCVLIVQYLRRGKVSKAWVIMFPIAIIVAYSLVDPFRDERNSNPNFEATSVHGIEKAIIDAQIRKHAEAKNIDKKEDAHVIKQEKDASLLLKVMSRTNLTYVAAVGIEYADTHTVFPEGSPDFAGNALQAPIGAYIPRFLWQGKAIQNIGIWYTQVVMGQPYSFSSTAMSIFTNLYFVGGTIAVFIGMYLIGMMQRIIFFVTKPWISAAGVIVYLSLMTKFEVIAEADSQTIIAFIFRIIPLLIILQSIIYNHALSQKDKK